jgi:hypothetical protein
LFIKSLVEKANVYANFSWFIKFIIESARVLG